MEKEYLATPDSILAEDDPGDETARRYRYQWIYAAILCCSLLDDTQDVSEIFCEHHEDVLLKHSNGKFSGIQIKTRASNRNAWKSNDEEIRSAIARFILLDTKFPGQFQSYRFVTNHFFQSSTNGQDLDFVIKEIKKYRNATEVCNPAQKFLKKIAREANCNDEKAFSTLLRVGVSSELPKLEDAFNRLVSDLTGVLPQDTNYLYKDMVKLANAIWIECMRASSLVHTDILPAYIQATGDIENSERVAILAGKRIDKSRLLQILSQGLNETSPLYGDPDNLTDLGTGTSPLLRQKLDAGGFSAVSLNSAEDLRDKADYLGVLWTKKYGHENGLQRYSHIRSLVLSDSATAFEATKTKNQAFGTEMLRELREKFAKRRADGDLLYECRNEHLEGFAYSLTAQCKVQWSLDRPWESK